jgi:chorismate synthase
MIEAVDAARKDGDSLGGVVECVARRVPAGWGEPVFDKLDGDLARAMISIPAAKGFEIGSGFRGTSFTGSAHNDPFVLREGRIRTETNFSGGVQGGISNGEDIVVRVAFKPTATVRKPMRTVTREGVETVLEARGRHDPCVVPRAVPIVEAMMALVLADHYLRHRGQTGHPGTAPGMGGPG